ncbi:MAG TPA: SNF2-related protein [Ktedonobacterales bacterium]|nr:SNF2-related protein [Ktedonobacterales bacterium]
MEKPLSNPSITDSSTLDPPIRVAFVDPKLPRHIPAAPVEDDLQAASSRWYSLALRAQSYRVAASFDRLLAPSVLYDRVRPHDYQLRVVEQALREKAPAVILADDVGLGKTIEAGLIYKELALRGIVRSALVLAPKALLSQWQEELREHFDEDFVLTDEKRFRGFEAEQRVICSLPQFVRSFARVNSRAWDMVIVDEAHLLANPESRRRQCASELRSNWRLLLTATPVANRLTDLYSLIDIAVPGRLGTQREFEDEYVADPGTCRVVRPERSAALRGLAREHMCRTRRSDTAIAFAGRTVDTRRIQATPAEDAAISDVTDYLRALYRRAPSGSSKVNRGAVIREIMALQQSLSSSPQAIERSLRLRAEKHPDERGELLSLANRCAEMVSAKESVLLDVIQELGDESVLIFTLRLETAARLRDMIAAQGRSAECYVGALNRAERESLVSRFNSGRLQTLIATDAGAEGLNLHERCHIVVNYDLHWNPMRIEQRIGRVHRLGQTRDVRVLNFVLRETIDDYVVRLLYQKINLFTMTVGALETVLSEVQEGEIDLEERILELLLRTDDSATLRNDVDDLGDELVSARERQLAAESLTAEVLR